MLDYADRIENVTFLFSNYIFDSQICMILTVYISTMKKKYQSPKFPRFDPLLENIRWSLTTDEKLGDPSVKVLMGTLTPVGSLNGTRIQLAWNRDNPLTEDKSEGLIV